MPARDSDLDKNRRKTCSIERPFISACPPYNFKSSYGPADTIGTVIMDFQGNLLAGTSTGGLMGKAKAKTNLMIFGLGFFLNVPMAHRLS